MKLDFVLIVHDLWTVIIVIISMIFLVVLAAPCAVNESCWRPYEKPPVWIDEYSCPRYCFECSKYKTNVAIIGYFHSLM